MALFKRKLFRRPSARQVIVGLGSSGLPWPLRWILGTRLISSIVFVLVPILITVGVLTLDWSNGWPRFKLNKERATEVTEVAKGLAEKVQAGIPEGVAETIREKIPDGLALDRWTSGVSPPPQDGTIAAPGTNVALPTSRDPSSTIRIASFNIQVFGTSKASKPEVMRVLADVVRRFDVVAIQELRTTDETVLERFLALINAGQGTYRYLVGPRLGRTNSKEQYVFVYDAARVDVDPQSLATVNDPQDYLHREPTYARFQVRSNSTQPGFSFILANIHTDPDDTDIELDALADVFVSLQRNKWSEDDVILLGDLNVSYQKLGRLGTVPNIAYTVQGDPTNTRGTKSYDNIVFDRVATGEFTGTAGILSLQQEYGLSMEQAIDVSDHLPVWAEFTVHEYGSQPPLAAQPARPPAINTPAINTPATSSPAINTPATSSPAIRPPATRGRGRVVENPLLRLRGFQR